MSAKIQKNTAQIIFGAFSINMLCLTAHNNSTNLNGKALNGDTSCFSQRLKLF
jgi:hypothetical protein